MGTINVAIVGVGNCASSLVQGIHKYSEADPEVEVPGLMHTVLGDYHVGDINVVADLPNVYLDTSGMLAMAGSVEDVVRFVGADRVIFGSDLMGRSLGDQPACLLR